MLSSYEIQLFSFSCRTLFYGSFVAVAHLFVPVQTAVATVTPFFLVWMNQGLVRCTVFKDNGEIKDLISDSFFWSFDSNKRRNVVWGLQGLRSLGLDFCSPQPRALRAWDGQGSPDGTWTLCLVGWTLGCIFSLSKNIFGIKHKKTNTLLKWDTSYGIGYYGTRPYVMF